MKYEGQIAETTTLRGHRGDLIDAYTARPLGAGPFPGVVVIHHMPGWDASHKEIARRFAHHGYIACLPNLQYREGKATPEENSASIRASGGMPDERTMGDVQAAIDYVRDLPNHNGKVGVIGYCSGGRQSWVAACTLDVDAAVDCYGGRADPSLAPNLRCPLLGLFGVEDQFPSPDDVATMAKALDEHGKSYDFHSYDGAGHAFFSVDRPSYRLDAAKDGWKQVWRFFGEHLQGA